MHTLHWIAVEAEDEDNAVDIVDQTLDSYMSGNDAMSTWYDWYVVGGGRWNTAEDDDSIWAGYTKKSNMVISYDKNPNAFRAKIDDAMQQRMADYKQYLAEVKESNVMHKLENYGGTMSYDPSFYALNRLLAYQMGEWSHDSWFFDIVHDSSNATHILSKLDNDNAKNIFLVPVDFHF